MSSGSGLFGRWRSNGDAYRGPVVAAVIGAVAVVLAALITAVVAALDDEAVSPPGSSTVPPSAVSPSVPDPVVPTSPGAPGSLFSGLVDLEMDLGPAIPQRSWDVDSRQSVDSVADFAVECRLESVPRRGCRSGLTAVYHLLPAGRAGVKAARVTGDAVVDRSVCHGAQFNSTYLSLSEGASYCVRTEIKLVGVKVSNLPIVSSSIVVRLLVTIWEQ